MKEYFIIICVIFNLSSSLLFSFKPAETLHTQLDKASGNHRVDILNQLAELYQVNSISKSIEYSSLAFKEGIKNNYPAGWSRGLALLCRTVNNTGLNKTSNDLILDFIEYFLSFEPNQFNRNIIKLYIGGYLSESGNYSKSIDYLVASLDYFRNNNYHNETALALTNLGWFYYYLQEFNTSGDNFLKAADIYLFQKDTISYNWNLLYSSVSFIKYKDLKKSDSINIELGKFSNCENMYVGKANYYRVKGLVSLELMDLDESEYYFNKAIDLYEELQWNQSTADLYTLRGHCSWKRGKYDSSLTYNEKALRIRYQLGSERYVASSIVNLGFDYKQLGNYKVALKYAKKGIKHSLNIRNYTYLVRSYDLVYQLCKVIGDTDSSLYFLELKMKNEKLLYLSERDPKTVKAQLRYELEKKEREIVEMALEEEKSKNFLFLAIVILVVLMIFIVYFRYRQKNADNKILVSNNQKLKEAYKKISDNENRLKSLNSELDNLVKERTNHLSSEIKQRIMAEETLIQSKKNIQNAYEKEKELNVMKSRFISMISHEFRTPMTVITSSAEIISMIGSKFLDDKAVKLAQKIKNSVKQMTLLIDEVIAFNNTERTHVNLLYENFEIVDFVRELVDEQKTVNKVNNIVNLSSDFNEINIVSDKQLLRHILSNIIGNAIKYTPEGKKVNIRIEKKQNLIHFLVSDEGVGIPSSDLDKIWEPFVRGRNIKNISGTGFGLYIVKDFVNKLNGEIKVTSKLDIGTNVSLIVPTTVN